jgi:hypothetical protein
MDNKTSVTITDCEDALRAMIDQLFMMYTYNGGEETKRTVMQLLKNIHRLSPWLEDMAKKYPEFEALVKELAVEKGE